MEDTLDTNFLNKTRVINRNVLKYIIIVLMLIDHLCHMVKAYCGYEGTWYVVGRLISRLTAPIMCFFLAEGFRYTRNVKKYILRLGLFAVISHLPFVFFETSQWLPLSVFDGNVTVDAASYFYIASLDKTLAIYQTSMIFTLFLGILALAICEKTNLHISLKILLVLLICAVSTFGDWSYWAILYVLCFYYLREKPVWKWTVYVAISLLYIFGINLNCALWPIEITPGFYLYRIGTLLVPLVIILFYNGKPGSKAKFHKWFFYAFYPVHLLLLGLIFTYLI